MTAKVLVALRVNPRDENVNLDELITKIKSRIPSEFKVIKH